MRRPYWRIMQPRTSASFVHASRVASHLRWVAARSFLAFPPAAAASSYRRIIAWSSEPSVSSLHTTFSEAVLAFALSIDGLRAWAVIGLATVGVPVTVVSPLAEGWDDSRRHAAHSAVIARKRVNVFRVMVASINSVVTRTLL